jgi:hypothetical protein
VQKSIRLESDIGHMSTASSESSGSEGVDSYRGVKLPDRDEIPRKHWRAHERRAELLQRIEAAGHPRELNQSALGDEYGVSQQQISKDFKKIGAKVRESLDVDRRALAVNSTVQRSIKGLLENEQWYRAGKLALEWDKWVAESDIDDKDENPTLVEALSE